VSYLGSKAASGAFQAIIAAMPPHDTYIESHLGTGKVMRAKPPAARSIGCDLDVSMLEEFSAPYAVELVHGSCADLLAGFDYAGSGRTFIYADPPYVLATRTSRHRYKYDYEDRDHDALAEILRSVPAQVAISGYASAKYDRLYRDWRRIEFQVMTRGGPRTECLWMNYAPGRTVISNYAGSNFTDRQRIKRKVARWVLKWSMLPAHERDAILASMLASVSDRT
jgi:site-specific DNA-adenine methylase